VSVIESRDGAAAVEVEELGLRAGGRKDFRRLA